MLKGGPDPYGRWSMWFCICILDPRCQCVVPVNSRSGKQIVLHLSTETLAFFEWLGKTQSSFVPGRQSVDNAIIVQEVIHSLKKKKGKMGWMVLKLDLEKAYDRLEWGFIRRVLHYFKFPEAVISLIMNCILSTEMAVVVNGRVSRCFKPSRGIRQGDPLSPYIFILCMEYPHQLIQKEFVFRRK